MTRGPLRRRTERVRTMDAGRARQRRLVLDAARHRARRDGRALRMRRASSFPADACVPANTVCSPFPGRRRCTARVRPWRTSRRERKTSSPSVAGTCPARVGCAVREDRPQVLTFAVIGPNRSKNVAKLPLPVLEDKGPTLSAHRIARRVVHGMFHGRDSPRTPARRPIASPANQMPAVRVGARQPWRRARVAPPRAVERDRRVAVEWPPLAEARGDAPGAGGPLGLVFARGGRWRRCWKRKLERADSTRGGDPCRAAATVARTSRRPGPMSIAASPRTSPAPRAAAPGAPARAERTCERPRAAGLPRDADGRRAYEDRERRARRADVRERALRRRLRRGICDGARLRSLRAAPRSTRRRRADLRRPPSAVSSVDN